MLRHRNQGSAGVFVVIGILVVGIVAFFIWYAAAWETIEPGMIGVVFNKRDRKVTQVAQPGWVRIDPWSETVQKYPGTDRTYVMVTTEAGDQPSADAVNVQDREGQKFSVDVAVQYAVRPDKIADFYAKFGGVPIENIEFTVVRNSSRAALTNIAPAYRWDEFNQKRGQIAEEIKGSLEKVFEANFLVLRDYDIRELNLPQPLVDALNAKVAKQQEVEKQRYELEQAKIKAQQDLAEATGRAAALREQAKGEADAIITRAQAQAEANRLLSTNLSDALVRYRWVERWDGKQPQMVGNATPLISMGEEAPSTEGR